MAPSFILCTVILSISTAIPIKTTCNDANPCSNQSISCIATGEDTCDITCSSPYSCYNTNVTCTSARDCNIICGSDEGPSNPSACASMSVTAIANLIVIQCKGDNACSSMSINAQVRDGINVDCTGENVGNCANLVLDTSVIDRNFTPDGSQEAIIQCGEAYQEGYFGPSDSSCYNTKMHCGSGLICDIQCASDTYSCWNTSLYCDTTSYECPGEVSSGLFNIYTPSPTAAPTMFRRYEVIREAISWEEAETSCQDLYGSHLASISTQEEFELVRNLTANLVYVGAWIGLNRLYDGNWSWVDGTVCNGSCQSIPFWKNGEEYRRKSVRCAIIDAEGDLNTEDCLNEDRDVEAYVCNAVPSVHYICVEKDGVWRFVLEYQNVYQYKYDIAMDGSVYILQWNETDFDWRLYKDNGTLSTVGLCISDAFILPSECDNWQFLDDNENVEFNACPC